MSAEEEDQWVEEEEEIIEEQHGGIAAAPNGTVSSASALADNENVQMSDANPQATTATSNQPNAAVSTSSESEPLISHLRHLIRPYGPLEFRLATTIEPSIVPVPTRSLYGGNSGGNVSNNTRKRNMDDDGGMTSDEFHAAVRDLKTLSLVRVGQIYPPVPYSASSIASNLALGESNSPVAPQAFLNHTTIDHIHSVEKFFETTDATQRYSSVDSASYRHLWAAHEYYDPHRLLTHPPQVSNPNQTPLPHPPATLNALDARFQYEHSQGNVGPASKAAAPLHCTNNVSFSSSHIALSFAELDFFHNFCTNPQQRSREYIAAALMNPPRDLFLTFVDLSGGEGFASEYILWRRRACNLRAKGWSYDLSFDRTRLDQSRENWSKKWINTQAKEQAKHFDQFHPCATPAVSSSALSDEQLLSQLISQQNIDIFVQMIEAQTNNRGVQLAFASSFANSPDKTSSLFQIASQCFRGQNSPIAYRVLLFQLETALLTLARGGDLVLQLWEVQSPLTLSILFLVFQMFDQCILHQTAAAIGYGSGQCYLLCRRFHHDRVASPITSSPIIAQLRQLKTDVFEPMLLRGGIDVNEWRTHSLFPSSDMIESGPFVIWIQKFNHAYHAFKLQNLLSILQPTPLFPSSLLDDVEKNNSNGKTDPDTAAALTKAGIKQIPIYPLPPSQHRIRLAFLQYTGMPVFEPFLGPAITRH